MLSANFKPKRKEQLRHRAVSLRQLGFLVVLLSTFSIIEIFYHNFITLFANFDDSFQCFVLQACRLDIRQEC